MWEHKAVRYTAIFWWTAGSTRFSALRRSWLGTPLTRKPLQNWDWALTLESRNKVGYHRWSSRSGEGRASLWSDWQLHHTKLMRSTSLWKCYTGCTFSTLGPSLPLCRGRKVGQRSRWRLSLWENFLFLRRLGSSPLYVTQRWRAWELWLTSAWKNICITCLSWWLAQSSTATPLSFVAVSGSRHSCSLFGPRLRSVGVEI